MSLYRCSECGDEIESLDELESHVTVEHLQWVPYGCYHCKLFKATVQQLRRHCQLKHPADKFMMVTAPDEDKQLQLKLILDRSKTGAVSRTAFTPVTEARSVSVTKSTPQPQTTSQLLLQCKAEPELISLDQNGCCDCPNESPARLQSADPCHKRPPATPADVVPTKKRRKSTDHCVPAAKENAQKSSKHTSPRTLTSEQKKLLALPKVVPTQFSSFFDKAHCRLCKAKPGNNAARHVYKVHLRKTVVRCGLCDYGCSGDLASAREHVAHAHPGRDHQAVLVDKRADFLDEVKAMYRRCFAYKGQSEQRADENEHAQKVAKRSSDGVEETVVDNVCKECGIAVAENGKKLKHVCSTHIEETLFECDTCDYKQNHMPSMSHHIHRAHTKTKNKAKYIDHRAELAAKIYSRFESCFGRKEADKSILLRQLLKNGQTMQDGTLVAAKSPRNDRSDCSLTTAAADSECENSKRDDHPSPQVFASQPSSDGQAVSSIEDSVAVLISQTQTVDAYSQIKSESLQYTDEEIFE